MLIKVLKWKNPKAQAPDHKQIPNSKIPGEIETAREKRDCFGIHKVGCDDEDRSLTKDHYLVFVTWRKRLKKYLNI